MKIPRYKPKILQLLFSTLMAVIIIKTPLTVHAYDFTVNHEAISSLASDMKGDSGATNTKNDVTNGASRHKTGYLCYLLTTDGQKVEGTNAVALQCPGYKGISVAAKDWLVKDRNNFYPSPSWSKTATAASYWDCLPWGEGGSSNSEQIKSWLEAPSANGNPKGCLFVEKEFGEDAAQGFANDEYVLVIETIMNFQYSISNKSSSNNNDEFYKSARREINKLSEVKLWQLLRQDKQYNTFRKEFNMANHDEQEEMLYDIRQKLIEELAKELRSRAGSGSDYKLVGNPVTGTVPELIKYKQRLGYERSYLDSIVNGTAPLAEYIEDNSIGTRAGFKAYKGPTGTDVTLSNKDIKECGVAMGVFSASGTPTFTTDTHTWDSTKNPPGTGTEDKPPEPPSSSTPTERKFTIIKSYRVKDKTTGVLEDKGTFKRTQTVASIRIEDEPLNDTDKNYKVIGWKQSSTDLPTSLTSLNWESKVPQLINETGDGPGTTKLPDTHRFLYVLLEAEKDTEPLEVNYEITQATIARSIRLSQPDAWLTLPHIESFPFK